MNATVNRIVESVSWEVSSAFGYDQTLVKRFKKSLRKELRRFSPSKKRLAEAARHWKALASGEAFRLRIAQRTLAWIVTNSTQPEIVEEAKTKLRITNAGRRL